MSKKTILYKNENVTVYSDYDMMVNRIKIYFHENNSNMHRAIELYETMAIYTAVKKLRKNEYFECQFTFGIDSDDDFVTNLATLKDYGLDYEILTMSGPSGGFPEVKVTGSKKSIQEWITDYYSSGNTAEDNPDFHKFPS